MKAELRSWHKLIKDSRTIMLHVETKVYNLIGSETDEALTSARGQVR